MQRGWCGCKAIVVVNSVVVIGVFVIGVVVIIIVNDQLEDRHDMKGRSPCRCILRPW
jgi:hypothetical protein